MANMHKEILDAEDTPMTAEEVQTEVVINEAELLKALSGKDHKDETLKIEVKFRGVTFAFRIRALSEREYDNCRERCTKYSKNAASAICVCLRRPTRSSTTPCSSTPLPSIKTGQSCGTTRRCGMASMPSPVQIWLTTSSPLPARSSPSSNRFSSSLVLTMRTKRTTPRPLRREKARRKVIP